MTNRVFNRVRIFGARVDFKLNVIFRRLCPGVVISNLDARSMKRPLTVFFIQLLCFPAALPTGPLYPSSFFLPLCLSRSIVNTRTHTAKRAYYSPTHTMRRAVRVYTSTAAMLDSPGRQVGRLPLVDRGSLFGPTDPSRFRNVEKELVEMKEKSNRLRWKMKPLFHSLACSISVLINFLLKQLCKSILRAHGEAIPTLDASRDRATDNIRDECPPYVATRAILCAKRRRRTANVYTRIYVSTSAKR